MKYAVTITEQREYSVTVDADDAQDARDIAVEQVAADLDQFYVGSAELEVESIAPLTPLAQGIGSIPGLTDAEAEAFLAAVERDQ